MTGPAGRAYEAIMPSPMQAPRGSRRPRRALAAVLAVACWTLPALAQDTARPAPEAAPAVEEAPQIQRLPALERFHVMLERPLFTATRRPPEVAEVPTEPTDLPEEQVVEETGPAPVGAPQVRFVGTVGQGGVMSALVLRGDATEVERLLVGDEVDSWVVTQVTASQLVMEHDGEQYVLNILQ
ncbi:MAG: hypothetical protein U1E14_18825 [Geminicoccaceae bacterium]